MTFDMILNKKDDSYSLLLKKSSFKIFNKEFFKKIKGERNVFIAKESRIRKLFSYAHSKGYRDFEKG